MSTDNLKQNLKDSQQDRIQNNQDEAKLFMAATDVFVN